MKTSPIITLLTGLLLATTSIAADPTTNGSTNPPAPTPTTPQPYTDQGTITTRETTTSNYYNYPSNSVYDRGWSSFDRTTTVRTQYRPIYYPPTPPALGETVFAKRTRVTLAKLAPPSALGEDVYEPFYAPLSTLLFTEDLSKKRRERLDGYHASRTSLLAELRAQLNALQNADAATRESSLATLAREQAPRLATLENAAEELRRNFTEGGFFDNRVNWNDTRDWRLGDDTRWESALDEIKVMRGAAAFQEGFSPAQRRLLRELAMELADSMKDPTDEIELSTPGPFIYFSPETARIRLPAEIPGELTAKIETYKAEKASLKKELRDILYEKDRAFFESTRVNAFKSLAETQAARFAAVEQLAEEIRRGLAPFPNPASPPALPLPAPLASRLTAYTQKKSALQTALIAKQDEVRSALPNDRVEFTRVSGVIGLNIVANRRSTPAQNEKRRAITETLTSFNAEQAKLYSALAQEKEAIHAELNRTVKELAGKKNIDQLQREFTYALKKQELWEQFHDYEIATLEPGLSPAQRVILFGAGLEKLDLPLSN